MNQIRGIHVSVNTSINGVTPTNPKGNRTRVRGLIMSSRGGSGEVILTDTVDPNNPGNTRIFLAAGTAENLTLPDSGLLFPNGVSINIPVSVVATFFIDP